LITCGFYWSFLSIIVFIIVVASVAAASSLPGNMVISDTLDRLRGNQGARTRAGLVDQSAELAGLVDHLLGAGRAWRSDGGRLRKGRVETQHRSAMRTVAVPDSSSLSQPMEKSDNPADNYSIHGFYRCARCAVSELLVNVAP
jgi:hypothetical protein